MSTIKSPLADQDRITTGEALQGALVDLIDLSLFAKQLHWNIIGRNFRSVHRQLDEVVNFAREYMDLAAERAISIGYNPDGQAATVASASQLTPAAPGYLEDTKVIAAMTEQLGEIIPRMRQRMAATEEADPVTQDLIIDILKGLEEQHWMFQAMV